MEVKKARLNFEKKLANSIKAEVVRPIKPQKMVKLILSHF